MLDLLNKRPHLSLSWHLPGHRLVGGDRQGELRNQIEHCTIILYNTGHFLLFTAIPPIHEVPSHRNKTCTFSNHSLIHSFI